MYNKEDVKKATLEYFKGDMLATDVWMKKYCLKDNSDNLYEMTPDDTHRRLAKELYKAESKFQNSLSEEEIYENLKDYKYIVLQGSPTSALGNPFQVQSSGNCFVQGTKVYTLDGVKNIEDVEIGDVVNTQTGQLKPVVQLHKNELGNRVLYNLDVYKTPRIVVTDNHKFLSISSEQLKWGLDLQENTVEYLRIGDYIAIPNQTDFEDIKHIDINDYIESMFEYENIEYAKEIFESTLKLNRKINYKHKTVYNKINREINRYWNIDSDFMYFIGLWYGDGCVFSEKSGKGMRDRIGNGHRRGVRGITFTFGSHETNIANFVIEYGSKLFGINADVNTFKDQNVIQIIFHSSLVGIVFEKLFGRYSHGKRLNKLFFKLNSELIAAFSQGLVDSDGTVTKAGDVRVVLSNKPLIREIYSLLRNRGIIVGYSEHAAGNSARISFAKDSVYGKNSKKTYIDDRISAMQLRESNTHYVLNYKGYTLVKITDKTISDLKPEYVYTLGVEDVHSYTVEGLITMNCYVVRNPHDSYPGILYTDEQLANLMKRRGGVGVDLSSLRSHGTFVNNAARTSEGVGLFMHRFSNTTREVGQSGRRGALMETLNVKHPDILDFIVAKDDKTKVTGANISVQITDEFMNAVINDTDFVLQFPIKSDNPIETKTVRAKDIWDKLIEMAHKNAEPGVMFIDTMNNNSTSHLYGKIDDRFYNITTNPCSEIVMGVDSCRLAAINLFSFVKNPFESGVAEFDFDLFTEKTIIAQRLLDDINEIELGLIDKIIAKVKSDPEPEHIKSREISMWEDFRATCEIGRRTGLGILGLGDAIAAIGLRYGSDESIEFTEKIYKTLEVNAYKSSIIMAKERGSFKIWDKNIDFEMPYFVKVYNEFDEETKEMYLKYGRRNIATTTTAPTGSISLMTKTTSGIEPLFLPFYDRRRKLLPNENIEPDFVDVVGDKWVHYTVYHDKYKMWMEISGETDYEKSPYYKSTSNDVDWIKSVKLQSAAQAWLSHSVSKTINLPEGTEKSVVDECFKEAWRTGCKGITVYVDGSRDGVLITNKEPKEVKVKNVRPEELPCDIHHVTANGQRYYVLVGLLNGKPYELFAFSKKHIQIPQIRKDGRLIKVSSGVYNLIYNGTTIENIAEHFESPEEDGFTRMVSRMLRHNISVSDICQDLDKSYSNISSFYKAISRTLKKNYMTDSEILEMDKKISGTIECPECGGSMAVTDGCVRCLDCGYSKC